MSASAIAALSLSDNVTSSATAAETICSEGVSLVAAKKSTSSEESGVGTATPSALLPERPRFFHANGDVMRSDPRTQIPFTAFSKEPPLHPDPSWPKTFREQQKQRLDVRSDADPPYRIFVGGLSREMSSRDLRTHFSRFYDVREAKVMLSGDGFSKGYGFVTLDSQADLESALSMGAHQLVLRGCQLNVSRAMRRPLIQQPDVNERNNMPIYVTVTPTGEEHSGVPAEFAYRPLLFTTPPIWFLERSGYPVYVRREERVFAQPKQHREFVFHHPF